MSQVPFSPAFGRKAGFFPFCVAAVLNQDFAFNLSTKWRLCHTVGGRFIDGVARCCAVSTARSRAAATTNLARSNQSLVLRAPFGWPKTCAPVNACMICPPMVGRSEAQHDQILSLIHGHLMARLTRQRATPRAGRGNAHCIRQGLSRPTWCKRRAPALWRRGEVQLDRLAASARARLDGELSGAGLEDQRRDLLGAVDADPGAEHPAAVQLQLCL